MSTSKDLKTIALYHSDSMGWYFAAGDHRGSKSITAPDFNAWLDKSYPNNYRVEGWKQEIRLFKMGLI